MTNLYHFADLVMHYKETSSTMNDANCILVNLKPLPDSFLILADVQTNGIGRNHNTWISRKGGLWFTYGIKVNVISQQMTLFLGHCLLETLKELFPSLASRLFIKWTNDILLDNNKLAGILVSAKQDYIMIGTGINTNNEPDKLHTAFQPISLKSFFDFPVSNQAILCEFLAKIQSELTQFYKSGLAPFHQIIIDNLYGLGKTVVFCSENGTIEGKCLGIAEDGTLILETVAGGICRCYSGSIIGFR